MEQLYSFQGLPSSTGLYSDAIFFCMKDTRVPVYLFNLLDSSISQTENSSSAYSYVFLF